MTRGNVLHPVFVSLQSPPLALRSLQTVSDRITLRTSLTGSAEHKNTLDLTYLVDYQRTDYGLYTLNIFFMLVSFCLA